MATRLSVAGGTVTVSGDTIIATPGSGNRLAIFYLNYNPETDNTCFWKFGTSGTPQLKTKVPANSVIARGFPDSEPSLVGGVNETLILNVSVAGNVNYTVYYRDTA